MLKGIVVGFILGVAVLGGGAYYYFSSGMAPVAVADPMMPYERKMANMALRAHILEIRTSVNRPSPPTSRICCRRRDNKKDSPCAT